MLHVCKLNSGQLNLYMKTSSLCTFAVAMLFIMACNKGSDPTPTGIKLSMSWDTIGAGEMVAALADPIAIITEAPVNTSFTYTISCSNGLYYADSADIKATAITDTLGKASLYIPGLKRYKDGELEVAVTFPDTTLSAKAIKQETVIRNYRDLMFINYPRPVSINNAFIQTADITFPDTTFENGSPITEFSGVYDGQFHKISNFQLSVTTSNTERAYVALFQRATHARIFNLRLELGKAGISSTGLVYSAGLIGYGCYSRPIKCSVTGNISNTGPAGSYVAGLIGYCYGDTLNDCVFRGKLDGGNVGGILGESNHSSMNATYAHWTGTVKNGAGLMATGSSSYIYNSYADLYNITYSNSFYDAYYALDEVIVYDAYSNYGTSNKNVKMFSSNQELINSAVALVPYYWPSDLAKAPNNKPFVLDGNTLQLWWE